MINDKPSLEEVVEHYGVKGMRWGVRKADRAARRKSKVERLDARAEMFQTKINELKKESGATGFRQQVKNRRALDKAIADRDRSKEDSERVKQGKLTKNQKRLAIGAAVAATYITYQSVQSGDVTRLAQKGKAFLDRTDSAWKKDPRLAKQDITLGEAVGVAHGVNPDYGRIGTKMNCRRATFTYEMRRRGYDVTATRTTNARGQTVLGLDNAVTDRYSSPWGQKTKILGKYAKTYLTTDDKDKAPEVFSEKVGGAKIISKSLADHSAIYDALSKQPNGARGELGVTWAQGGGHSMAWEIIKGKPVILDTQTGDIYKTVSDLTDKLPMVKESSYSRLDNATLDTDFLLRWMK